MDKTEWGDGPWQTEPDEVTFDHEGYTCWVLRHEEGNLCGYVELPDDHPLSGHGRVELAGIQCHGGLTFVGVFDPRSGNPLGATGKCYLGFDCGHGFDLKPAQRARFGNFDATFGSEDSTFSYRDMEYTKQECRGIAEQLLILKEPSTRAAARLGGFDAAKEVHDQDS